MADYQRSLKMLCEKFDEIYLKWKAHDRAVRAHNLLSSILSTKICRVALIDDDMKKEASDMFQSLMKDGFNTSLDLPFIDSISWEKFFRTLLARLNFGYNM